MNTTIQKNKKELCKSKTNKELAVDLVSLASKYYFGHKTEFYGQPDLDEFLSAVFDLFLSTGAFTRYNRSRSSFSTYVYYLIKRNSSTINIMLNHNVNCEEARKIRERLTMSKHREEANQFYNQLISLDEVLSGTKDSDDGFSEIKYADVMLGFCSDDYTNLEKEVVEKAVKDVLHKYKGKKDYFIYYVSNYPVSLSSIARKFNVSRQCVEQSVHNIRNKINNKLKEEGFYDNV